jgi:protocatechuate 3,4-dioxygenase beta subunit
MSSEAFKISRRGFLRASVALSAPVVLTWVLGRGPAPEAGNAAAQALALTPECLDADHVTPEQTEGPYFTRNSPERSSLLEPGMAGTRLVVSGTVFNAGCQPIPAALLDFWQADDRGQYDNVGYRLRGHQFTDADGHYSLETIVPGLYPGRTRHIHVKAQAPGARVLTTQLYFQGEPGNQRDGIFTPELAMNIQDIDDGSKSTQFDFVVGTA